MTGEEERENVNARPSPPLLPSLPRPPCGPATLVSCTLVSQLGVSTSPPVSAAQRSKDLGKTVADSNLRLPSLSIQPH